MKSNFFPIQFDFEEFQIQQIPYTDGLLQALRQKYNATHSFFRRGNYIYISPGTEDAETLGEVVTMKINDNIDVVSSLVKHIFFRSITGSVKLLPTFYPFTFAAQKDIYDLIFRHLPDNLKNVITYKRITDIQFRVHDKNEQPVLVAVINNYYQWNISKNGLELENEGFGITGLEVNGLSFNDSSAGVVAPELSFLGRVIEVKGNKALVDTNKGKQEYSLSDLSLFKSNENILHYLGSFLGETRANEIINAAKTEEATRLNAAAVMAEIESLGKWLSSISYKNYDSFGFTILNNSVVNGQSIQVDEPKLIFDVSGTSTHTTPSVGLNTYGPYSRSTSFDVNSPKVLMICHQQHAGSFTKFLAELKNGIPNHSYFANGMVRKYSLTSMEYRIGEINDYSVKQYLDTISKIIRAEEAPFDIAIIETKEEFKRLAPEDNPYYQVKALLYLHGISVQFIKAETVRSPTYSIDGIALQIYAKLGGTPWTVPTSQSVDHELVIGIGSSIIRSNRYAGAVQTRVVGISTFFSADGKYISNSKTQDVSYEAYFDELLHNLKTSIERISNSYSWASGDRIRIIFHIFKPIKYIEADVVSKLIEEYTQYDIKFAFVTFSERHPYVLFNEKERGEFGKGQFVPRRSYNILLDKYSCLIQMIGPKEIRAAQHGAPTPVLIRVHQSSTFLDLTYIVQQAFKFTRLSYRSFNPAHTPITLLYSNMLARQLKVLKNLPNWNYEVANAKLRNKKWFL